MLHITHITFKVCTKHVELVDKSDRGVCTVECVGVCTVECVGVCTVECVGVCTVECVGVCTVECVLSGSCGCAIHPAAHIDASLGTLERASVSRSLS